MSGWRTEIARRPLLAGLLGIAGLGILGGAAFEGSRILAKQHAASAYDDLISKLANRDNAVTVGQAVIGDLPKFNPVATARALRRQIGKHKLADIAMDDLAKGQLTEAGGWILPESVGLICALAAKA